MLFCFVPRLELFSCFFKSWMCVGMPWRTYIMLSCRFTSWKGATVSDREFGF